LEKRGQGRFEGTKSPCVPLCQRGKERDVKNTHLWKREDRGDLKEIKSPCVPLCQRGKKISPLWKRGERGDLKGQNPP
jgi:hypothetical protein